MAITIESALERAPRSEPMDSLLRMLSEVVILRSPVFQMFCMLYIEIESCPGYDVSTISCGSADTACRACAYRKHGTARNAGGRALQCLCFCFLLVIDDGKNVHPRVPSAKASMAQRRQRAGQERGTPARGTRFATGWGAPARRRRPSLRDAFSREHFVARASHAGQK
ncbi:MC152.1 [Molluscum contagiosum virus subtype 2]|uniref:MC152.1 n=2 Tax=Molluscum contagiosum virus TaxID=10279 RepID=A0A1S7DLZ3_MCV2|nr:MC152.1 [Molluscum contagiosum virus subtype 2]QHW16541.1 MC152.1R [Molluscum contagiosum virus]AYO87787.1 MC152.1 [Molluscum contagiosum virus subtype 2]AYO87957.1 MC152.1 [Molluscum contagiosum virus subtype 2]AYO88127.1 MC152.1 [Molluscum contagiosum virus subtype 2]